MHNILMQLRECIIKYLIEIYWDLAILFLRVIFHIFDNHEILDKCKITNDASSKPKLAKYVIVSDRPLVLIPPSIRNFRVGKITLADGRK